MINFKNSRNALLTGFLALLCSFVTHAQPLAYYNSVTFNTPANSPFVETYLTLIGKSLAFRSNTNNQLQNAVSVHCRILQDSNLIRSSHYNLLGPGFASRTEAPAFIDVQRYSLPNGRYTLEVELRDAYDSLQKPLLIKQDLVVDFQEGTIQASGIQALESYKKAAAPGPLSKSGFDLVPYNVDYYPETTKELQFYLETYNASKTLGEGRPFIYTYYIENDETTQKLQSYGAFKKEKASAVNPLLARIDISKLGTGNYNLVVELRDEKNELKLVKKYFFQRMNKAVDIAYIQKYDQQKTVEEYFGQVNDADTLKMFVECLWPIAGTTDKERVINQSIKKDPELMKKFVIDFWQRRAADTANPLQMWARYYQEVQKAMVLFKCGKQPGYYTERGRVFLQYGAPNQRAQQPNEANTYPYEIWQYYRLTDATNGQFFSNRKFVFVSKNLGDDCHNLVHSDMRGEIYNPRWQYEVTRRNTNGIGNPDNDQPSGTQYNQFNEIYNNPR